MKKRYLYALFFGIPGLFVAGILSILLFGAIAGILWLYVFGDNPWPSYAEAVLSVLFVLSVLTIWVATLVLGYVVGKRLETDPGLKRSHVLLSLGLTVAFLLLILFQQWSVGSFETQTHTLLCSEFCARHGYSESGMPPRDSGEMICSCFDDSGNTVLAVPLDQIIPVTPK
ncbi:MAG TPA: hypothetical protein VGK56_04915 [Anaerolineales bacterium]|jgi:hypothetical protein